MRVSEAALALITRVNPHGETEYLTQWNEKWQAYSLIGGHRNPEESFRDCCLREIEEELDLKRDVDFQVGSEPVGPTCEYKSFSKSAGEETLYRIELFSFQFSSQKAMKNLELSENNRWLRFSEITNRETIDGRSVADQIGSVFNLTVD